VRGHVRPFVTAALALSLACFVWAGSAAHTPITSPYTFNEDVFPIVRERCAACHVPGGVAPMSLITYAEAVPWGESMRVELMAGHMPPWALRSAPGRFRNVQRLTARELNVLLTWASGGTPAGDPDKTPAPGTGERTWPLGPPDDVIVLPEVKLPAAIETHVAEVTLPAGSAARTLRAVDLLPGTPAIVRSAIISAGAPRNAPVDSRQTREQLLSLWVPGDHPVALDPSAAYHVPAGAPIVVRVHYRKTWEYEQMAMTDRSRIGLYLAEARASELRAVELGPSTTVISEPVRAVAIYPDPALANAVVTVTAIRPDRSREELIAFEPREGWARRYWFRDPIALPRGTRIEVQARTADDVLPPGSLPAPIRQDAVRTRLTLNVVTAD
jgi:hypothetical protein